MIADRPTLAQRTMSAEAFDAFALLPENRDRNFEWHEGRVIELVSNASSSHVGVTIAGFVGAFVPIHRLGWITGADGGYIVNGERYIPDAAYMAFARQRRIPKVAYNSLAPDLAIEILSPSDAMADIRAKIVNYLLAGTVVWLADPVEQTIEVFAPGQKARKLTLADTLDGGDVLPGFSVPVRDLFPDDIDDALEAAE